MEEVHVFSKKNGYWDNTVIKKRSKDQRDGKKEIIEDMEDAIYKDLLWFIDQNKEEMMQCINKKKRDTNDSIEDTVYKVITAFGQKFLETHANLTSNGCLRDLILTQAPKNSFDAMVMNPGFEDLLHYPITGNHSRLSKMICDNLVRDIIKEIE